MAVRNLLKVQEQVQDLILAAEQRYYDGLELLIASRYAAGVYLIGYAAEMVLKHAFLRASGLLATAPVTVGNLRTAKQFAEVAEEGFHSLLFWAQAVGGVRIQLGVPLEAGLALDLTARAARLHENWDVSMRYQPLTIGEQDAQLVYDDVSWMIQRQVELWR